MVEQLTHLQCQHISAGQTDINISAQAKPDENVVETEANVTITTENSGQITFSVYTNTHGDTTGTANYQYSW